MASGAIPAILAEDSRKEVFLMLDIGMTGIAANWFTDNRGITYIESWPQLGNQDPESITRKVPARIARIRNTIPPQWGKWGFQCINSQTTEIHAGFKGKFQEQDTLAAEGFHHLLHCVFRLIFTEIHTAMTSSGGLISRLTTHITCPYHWAGHLTDKYKTHIARAITNAAKEVATSDGPFQAELPVYHHKNEALCCAEALCGSGKLVAGSTHFILDLGGLTVDACIVKADPIFGPSTNIPRFSTAIGTCQIDLAFRNKLSEHCHSTLQSWQITNLIVGSNWEKIKLTDSRQCTSSYRVKSDEIHFDLSLEEMDDIYSGYLKALEEWVVFILPTNAPISSIILTGGGASYPRIQGRIKDMIERGVNGISRVELIIAENPRLTVCDGLAKIVKKERDDSLKASQSNGLGNAPDAAALRSDTAGRRQRKGKNIFSMFWKRGESSR